MNPNMLRKIFMFMVIYTSLATHVEIDGEMFQTTELKCKTSAIDTFFKQFKFIGTNAISPEDGMNFSCPDMKKSCCTPKDLDVKIEE